MDSFIVEAMGHRLFLSNGETLELVKGDTMKIADILPGNLSGVQVNFKGFIGNKSTNSGEDRGYVIDTAKDLMEKYSLDKNGETYPVIVSRGDKILGGFKVKLVPPKLDYLSLKINNTRRVLLGTEDSLTISNNDQVRLEDIGTNLYNKADISLNINGKILADGGTEEIVDLCTSRHNEVSVLNGTLLIGTVYLDIERD